MQKASAKFLDMEITYVADVALPSLQHTPVAAHIIFNND